MKIHAFQRGENMIGLTTMCAGIAGGAAVVVMYAAIKRFT